MTSEMTWKRGDRCEVRWQTEWYPGTLVSLTDAGCARVEADDGCTSWTTPIADLRRPSVPDVASVEAAPSPDVRPWRVGDEIEVHLSLSWTKGWHPARITRISPGALFEVGGKYADGTGWQCEHLSDLDDATIFRRPITKPSADQTPASAEAPPRDGYEVLERAGALLAGSRWNTTCRCGAPAYESLLSRECSRGEACPIVAPEPEPLSVAPCWLTARGDGSYMPADERGFCAQGPAGDRYVTVKHPTEAGAVALWRERVRGGR